MPPPTCRGRSPTHRPRGRSCRPAAARRSRSPSRPPIPPITPPPKPRRASTSYQRPKRRPRSPGPTPRASSTARPVPRPSSMPRSSVPGTFTYTPARVRSSGRQRPDALGHLHAHRHHRLHHRQATASINVSQATPTITWANPADIVYGTALSATQLDATASVPGNVLLHPGRGYGPLGRQRPDALGHLHAHRHHRLHHRPGHRKHQCGSQATPTITWTSPASIVYGTALGSTQLDATANVLGHVRLHTGRGYRPKGG